MAKRVVQKFGPRLARDDLDELRAMLDPAPARDDEDGIAEINAEMKDRIERALALLAERIDRDTMADVLTVLTGQDRPHSMPQLDIAMPKMPDDDSRGAEDQHAMDARPHTPDPAAASTFAERFPEAARIQTDARTTPRKPRPHIPYTDKTTTAFAERWPEVARITKE